MPIKEISIHSNSEYLETTLNDVGNRIRSSFVFRGVSKSSYTLSTSLARVCADNLALENSLLRNFSKHIPNAYQIRNLDVWDIMIIGQHNGLPTRFLDWTRSPLTALHFATLRNFDSDGAVWMINAEKINNSLNVSSFLAEGNKYLYTIEDIRRLSGNGSHQLTNMDTMLFDSILLFAPPNIDDKIYSQGSVLSLSNKSNTDYVRLLSGHSETSFKLIIPREIKQKIRHELDTMNVTEATLFPDLNGLAKYLARYYSISNRTQPDMP